MSSGQFRDEGEGPIRIGIAVPEMGTGQLVRPPSVPPPGGLVDAALAVRARLDLFCEALARALGVPVEAYGVAHYRELLDAMHEGQLDLAWLPPIIALRATARGRTLPIAIPVRGGAASFSSALFTRPGSSLKRPADLLGVRAAWVDRQSAAGYLVVRASLRAQGFDLERAFASESFLGSHDAVVQAVLGGAADVGATFVHLDAARNNAVLRAGWGTATPQVIAYGGPIPNDVVAAGIHVPVPTIRAVQRALCGAAHAPLRVAADKLMGAEGFVVPQPEHLDPLGRLLEYLDDLHNQSAFPPPLR
jgi:phosphate/phosphite/phosphonate ABC transporter binding protein